MSFFFSRETAEIKLLRASVREERKKDRTKYTGVNKTRSKRLKNKNTKISPTKLLKLRTISTSRQGRAPVRSTGAQKRISGRVTREHHSTRNPRGAGDGARRRHFKALRMRAKANHRKERSQRSGNAKQRPKEQGTERPPGKAKQEKQQEREHQAQAQEQESPRNRNQSRGTNEKQREQTVQDPKEKPQAHQTKQQLSAPRKQNAQPRNREKQADQPRKRKPKEKPSEQLNQRPERSQRQQNQKKRKPTAKTRPQNDKQGSHQDENQRTREQKGRTEGGEADTWAKKIKNAKKIGQEASS